MEDYTCHKDKCNSVRKWCDVSKNHIFSLRLRLNKIATEKVTPHSSKSWAPSALRSVISCLKVDSGLIALVQLIDLGYMKIFDITPEF